jgi:hypothetical protein
MKKFAALILSIITLSTAMSVNAAGIPRASAPESATEEQIVIVENLIGDILDEVAAGNVGYTEAAGYANTRVRKAVIAGQTNGNGYGILSPIAQNAIRTTRDMLLRPEVYEQYEEYLKTLLADLIIEVENGSDYKTAQEAAYLRIYQSADTSYTPRTFATDFCYVDTPPVDSAVFYVARKLLLDAIR